jgi:hypothetical protein
LLSIVETLKEFRDILLVQQAIVHTDHLNILYGKLSNNRITKWRLLLEEYGPTYVHIAGKNSKVADALSRLEKDEDEKLSETEEGLVLSHEMCTVEQNGASVLPESKHDLVHQMLNYSHSRNPPCAPARTHGQIQAPREPPN